MKKDEPYKTRKFIKGGIIFWIISIVLFFGITFLEIQIDNEKLSEFLSGLSSVIFMTGICMIPVILILTIPLKLAEKLIDKLPTKDINNKRK